jgi:hypothetical protein
LIEPLGKGYSRDYEWPQVVSPSQTRFGLPTSGLESAKEILFPAGSSNQDAEIQALYRMTHGNF